MEQNLKKLVLNTQKRRGRGIGSGQGGHTVGYGQKGQGSRGAHKIKNTDVGGQIPLFRKLPTQQGFKSLTPRASIVRIQWLNLHTEPGQLIDPAFLFAKGIIKKVNASAKIIGKDKVAHKLTIKNVPLTAGAKQAIVDAGGNVID